MFNLNKILYVKSYEKQVEEKQKIINELEKKNDKKHFFELIKDFDNFGYYTIKRYYNNELMSVMYDSIDNINTYLKATLQTIIDLQKD